MGDDDNSPERWHYVHEMEDTPDRGCQKCIEAARARLDSIDTELAGLLEEEQELLEWLS